MGWLRTLFSKTGIIIVIYLVIGFAIYRAYIPGTSHTTVNTIASWIQFVIYVMLWPVGLLFSNPLVTFRL